MDTGVPGDTISVDEGAEVVSPGLTPRKGKRQAEGELEEANIAEEPGTQLEGKHKRMKRTERPPAESKPRPVRERRQSSYSISRGFLDDKYFDSLEKRTSKQEAKRAAFYDTQSYAGDVVGTLPASKMSMQERDAFPLIKDRPKLINLYLFHRNSILSVAGTIEPKYLSHTQYETYLNATGHQMVKHESYLIQRIWKFLHVNQRLNKTHKQVEAFENESPDESEDDFPDPAAIPQKFEKRVYPALETPPSRKSSAKTNVAHPSKPPAVPQHTQTQAAASSAPEGPVTAPAAATPPHVSNSSAFIPIHASGAISLRIVKNPDKPSSTHSPSAGSSRHNSPRISPPKHSTKDDRDSTLGASEDLHSKSHKRAKPASYPASSPAPNSTSHKSKESMDVALPKPPQSAVPGTSPNMVHITSSASTPVPQNQKLPSKKPNSSRPKSMRSKKDDELLPPVGHDGPLLIPQNIPPTAATLKVCVIGAGIAGLAAAQFLHQHGINNVVVYESRLRIGGRVQSMSIDGHIVEMGAQFIQDNAANPIVDMCSQLHLRLQSLTNENAGSELLKMFTEKRDPLMREHFPDIDEQKASKAIAADNQMDLSKPLPATDLPIKPHLNAPQAPQHNSTTATDGAYPRSKYDLFMLGAAPTDLSYDMPMYTHEYSDRPAIVLDGLSELVRNMAIGLDIRLGHHVDVVNWNQDFRTDSVLLRYTDAHGQVRNESFDAVIVAVPLGVLKTQTLRFQPPLPYDKAQAIDGLRVGHQNKLILIFEEAFWSQEKMQAPTDDQTSEILTDPSATQPKRKGVVWQDESLGLMAFDCQVGTDLSTATKAAGSESFAALQVVWCGDLALTMNNLQPKECADAIVDKLAQAFSGQATPTLKGFVWVPWSADPHCLGAHSYVPRDEHPSVRLAFAEPFHCGRIGFAGEHTHMVHPSSLHGAYESGIREARRIIHSFTECPVGRLAHPFDQPVSYQTYADLPWKGADENSLATADLSGLPKVAVRLPAMEMAS